MPAKCPRSLPKSFVLWLLSSLRVPNGQVAQSQPKGIVLLATVMIHDPRSIAADCFQSTFCFVAPTNREVEPNQQSKQHFLYVHYFI